MNIHRNGRVVVLDAQEEASFSERRAAIAADALVAEKAARALALRDEAADIIDESVGIDTTLPPEHRTRELIMLNSVFADLLNKARGRPLAAPEQAQLDGLQAAFDNAKSVRAAEAIARAEVASAKDATAVRAVAGVRARLP